MRDGLARNFPRCAELEVAAPVWCVTPAHDRTLHRFFDSSPVSPSGRFLAVTRIPCEDRLPSPGELAEVSVIDLVTGGVRTVDETAAWDTQLGAQVQWGADDTELYYNALSHDTWQPHGVKFNLFRDARKNLDGAIYAVSPDGTMAASGCLLRIGRVQPGYGVLAPPDLVPRNVGAPDDDGIYMTDTRSGRSRLLVSLAQIVEASRPKIAIDTDSALYVFHVRFSPDGRRLQAVVCLVSADPTERRRVRRQLITMRSDGSQIRVAIPGEEWAKGGHHPSWCPDSEHVMMNLNLGGEMRFVRARHDGSGLEVLNRDIVGSGHPSMHPDERHILTDAYPRESPFADGTVPLRLIEARQGHELMLARVPSVPPFAGPTRELRVDPHPAWDRSAQLVVFNAYLGGTRRVCIADLSSS